MCGILIFAIGFCCALGQGSTVPGLPQVRWEPGTEVEEGGTVQLECQVSRSAAGPAIWLKLDPVDPHNHEILSHGEILFKNDSRFSVRYMAKSNTYVVKITDVSASDVGSYQCQVPANVETAELQAAPPVFITMIEKSRRHLHSQATSAVFGSHIPAGVFITLAWIFKLLIHLPGDFG